MFHLCVKVVFYNFDKRTGFMSVSVFKGYSQDVSHSGPLLKNRADASVFVLDKSC
jgi:hypothetical protein